MPRIDVSISLGIKPGDKLSKSIAETKCRVHKPKTYSEKFHNFIYGNRQREAIDKEL